MSGSGNRGVQIQRGRGRRRVNMERIPNESNLQVTFSKRRSGLFKKASELSTLCGVDIGIIVFSPTNKTYSFGNPNIQTTVDRFLTHNHEPPSNPVDQYLEAFRNSNVVQRNLQLTDVDSNVEALRKSSKERDDIKSVGQSQHWIPSSTGLDIHQIQEWYSKYTQIKNITDSIIMNAANPAANYSSFFTNPTRTVNPSFGGVSGYSPSFAAAPYVQMAGIPHYGSSSTMGLYGAGNPTSNPLAAGSYEGSNYGIGSTDSRNPIPGNQGGEANSRRNTDDSRGRGRGFHVSSSRNTGHR